jgi:hypothetical protein
MIGGDSQQDIVTANHDSGDLSFFQGFPREGAGLLYPDSRIPMPSPGAAPTAVDVGLLDLGGDLVAVDEANDEVAVWFNTGAATPPPFAPVADLVLALPPGCMARDVKIVDISNDGYKDILVACYGLNSVAVFEHDQGSPPSFPVTFQYSTTPLLPPGSPCDPTNFAGCGPSILAIGGLDDTGGQDVVVGCVDSYDLAVLLNTETSGFLTATSLDLVDNPPLGSPGEPTGLCIANMDPVTVEFPRLADVVVSQANAGAVFSHVSVYSGDGQGHLNPPGVGSHAQFTTGLGISDIACRDVDGNDLPDIAVATSLSGIVSVALNLLDDPADPRFEFNPLNCPAGGLPGAIVIDDVSGDGNLDILTANPTSDSVSYVPGRPGGRFKCTLTQSFSAVGIVDMAMGKLDDDAEEDLVLASHASQAVSLGFGSGLDGADEFDPADDVFEWDPVTEPDSHNLLPAGSFAGLPVLSVATGDFDFDGDVDVACLLGYDDDEVFTIASLAWPAFSPPPQFSGPVVEIFYNTDRTVRGSFDNSITDTHPTYSITFLPVLPLYRPDGTLLPGYDYSDADTNRAFELLMEDVNHDGLHDAIVLLPSYGGTNPHLVITLNPGITGEPEDGHFGPGRYIDWTNVVTNVAAPDSCSTIEIHGGGQGSDYPPAVFTCKQGLPTTLVTQFSFDLGAIQARSITVADAYPRDGRMEVVVTDETNLQLLVYGIDHTQEMESWGRSWLEAFMPAGLGYADGFPRGLIATVDPVCAGDPLCLDGVAIPPLTPYDFRVVDLTPSGAVAGPTDCWPGDINDDGLDDTVASIYADPALGDRGFLSTSQVACSGTSGDPYGPARWAGRKRNVLAYSGDFNRDGTIDAMAVSDQAEVASAFYFDPVQTTTYVLEEPPGPEDVLPASSSLLVPRVDHIIGAGDQSALVEGDVNNDGKMDVIISTGAAGGRSEITIMLGSY